MTYKPWQPTPQQKPYEDHFNSIRTVIRSMIDADIKANGYGSEKYMALKNIDQHISGASNSFCVNGTDYITRIQWALETAKENGLNIPGLADLAAELTDTDWGDAADANAQRRPQFN